MARGDGLERTIRFLEPMNVSLISGSRRVLPFGLNGGGSGACGENLRLDRDGVAHPLPESRAAGAPGRRGHSHAHPRGRWHGSWSLRLSVL